MPDDPLFFYFAWVDEGTAFDAATHATSATKIWDGVEGGEHIYTATISQDEGDFASLEIDLPNPTSGLIAPGRKRWCWFSWFDGSNIQPLFTGEIVAFQQQIDGEVARLLFVAQPPDFATLKAELADSLKELPYWDRVWIANDDDPDAILQSRSAVWHIDRVTLDVSISDVLVGEAGTLTFISSFYNNLQISYGQPPLKRVRIRGTLSRTQSGSGTIDLTEEIYREFRGQKSIHVAPNTGVISTLTGDGLKTDWPKGGTSFGGGWSVDVDTIIVPADERIFPPFTYEVKFRGLAPGYDPANTSRAISYFSFTDYIVQFPVTGLKQTTKFDWNADIKRSEILECTLEADIQPLLSQSAPAADAEETIDVSASDTVTEPDEITGIPPIGDLRRKFYLPTERGRLSAEYLLLLARDKLRRRARAVEVQARVAWADGIAITCRHSAEITDTRLPGGAASGKVKSYKLVAGADGNHYCDIEIGCSIGRGGAVSAALGTGVYAAPGYMNPGYQIMIGAEETVVADQLVYEQLVAIDDAGPNLLTLGSVLPGQPFGQRHPIALTDLTLTGGLSTQVAAVTNSSNPPETLKSFPSRVCVQFVEVAGLTFETIYQPAVQPLPIPQTIDLEAP